MYIDIIKKTMLASLIKTASYTPHIKKKGKFFQGHSHTRLQLENCLQTLRARIKWSDMCSLNNSQWWSANLTKTWRPLEELLRCHPLIQQQQLRPDLIKCWQETELLATSTAPLEKFMSLSNIHHIITNKCNITILLTNITSQYC